MTMSFDQTEARAIIMALGSAVRFIEDYGRTALGKHFLRQSLAVDEYVGLMGACSSFTDKLGKPKTKLGRKHLEEKDEIDAQQNELADVHLTLFRVGAKIAETAPGRMEEFENEMFLLCQKYL
jgi:hypothetical protein